MQRCSQRILKHLFIGLGLTLFINSAHAALLASNLGGGTENAVYDDVLDITWLANANLAASNTFGVSDINSVDGRMNWNTAEAWIGALNAADGGTGYLGVNTWRQPTVSPVNGISFDTIVTFDGSTDSGYQLSAPVDANNPNRQSPGFTGSELAYHYYNNLGAIGACSLGTTNDVSCISDNTLFGVDNTNTSNLDLFDNLQNGGYWTGTELSDLFSAFVFGNNDGSQSVQGKFDSFHFVWVVADGNVATVPVPAALWLMASALLGLVGFRKKQRSN